MTPEWMEPQGWPQLGAGEVHIWLAHLPIARARLKEFAQLLSAEERERAARFRFATHQERSQIARGILRSLLGRYLGCDARAISFSCNAHGKPELVDSAFHFNTSHSGDYAVFAITQAGRVGVDIEQLRREMFEHEAIAQRHFAPGEQQQLSAVPEEERAAAFFRLWTRKEAFVKARGDGLFSGLDQFETALDGTRLVSIRGARADDWWTCSLPDVPGYAAAVVVNAPACTPHFWRWK